MSSFSPVTSLAGATPTVPAALRRKEQALHTILADLESVIVAFSGGVDSAYLALAATRVLGARALAVTADSPSYPDDAPAAGASRGRRVSHRARSDPHRASSSGRSTAPTPRTAATTASRSSTRRCPRCSAARGLCRHRRRQQRRRSRRLSPRAAGGARVRRPQPARRSRAGQGRDPPAVACRRPADLGRAGIGVPVVAHPVRQRSHGGEAADDRAGRNRAPRARLPCLPRAPSRHRRAARDRPRRNAARARACRGRASSSRGCERSAISTSPSTCRDIVSAA